jgi:phosphate starvation-inducible PhoH-like protein
LSYKEFETIISKANFSIDAGSFVFITGASGSGKSMIAAGLGSEHLHFGRYDQIIITRPLICTGKDIGALPGDISEKIAPFLVPMQEYFKLFLGNTFYTMYFNEKKIRYEPLEVMRGATFHNTYMILDEAQNCTFDQIKMFITRIGENSKVIINGDAKQNDLKTRSGLEMCMNKLTGVEGVGVIYLDNSDIQRNGIIGRVLNALES